MVASSFQNHMEITPNKILTQACEANIGGEEEETYVVSFQHVLILVACPVEGFLSRLYRPGSLREHYMNRYWESKISILEDNPSPLLKCTNCVMHMTSDRLERNTQTTRCNITTGMRLQRRDMDLAQR